MSFRFPQFKMNYAASGQSVSILEKDIKEATKCFDIGANKSTMLLSGSILENALFDILSMDEWIAEQTYLYVCRPIRPLRLEEWTLYDMLRASRELGIITDETYQLCDLLRDYRNLIHPAVVRRTLMEPNKTRARRSLEALRQALGELDRSFASIWQEAYIINITGVPGCFINNPNALQTTMTTILQQFGIHTNLITTLGQLSALLRNPPKAAIVMNTHGEIMPVPTGIDWRDHFRGLCEAVMNYGWILVNTGGYPFYYEAHNRPVGQNGLNEFLSPVNMTANCMNATNASFTNNGRRVIRNMNMLGLPHALPANRCARWQGASQKIVFLANGNLCGISAIRIGRGWFVNLGLDSNLGITTPTPQQLANNDAILGNFAVGTALLVAARL